MIDIKSLTLPELQEEMEKIGEKKFRAGQIYEWMHVKLVDSFDEMTNLSKGLREKLKEQYELISLELVEVQTSKIDETSKFLFRSVRWKCDRERVDEISPRQFSLYFLAGRLPYGLSVLRVHVGRTGAWVKTIRDAGSDL